MSIQLSNIRSIGNVVGTPVPKLLGKRASIVKFDSLCDIQNTLFSAKAVMRCCHGEQRTHRGYTWELLPDNTCDRLSENKVLNSWLGAVTTGILDRDHRRKPKTGRRYIARVKADKIVEIYHDIDDLTKWGFDCREVLRSCNTDRTYRNFYWKFVEEGTKVENM